MLLMRARVLAHNLRKFTNLAELNEFLATSKPVHSLVYFRASWNPLCKKTDLELEEVANRNRHWNIASVDMDLP
jgi:thioredoxin-like negative regulator of GroEL